MVQYILLLFQAIFPLPSVHVWLILQENMPYHAKLLYSMHSFLAQTYMLFQDPILFVLVKARFPLYINQPTKAWANCFAQRATSKPKRAKWSRNAQITSLNIHNTIDQNARKLNTQPWRRRRTSTRRFTGHHRVSIYDSSTKAPENLPSQTSCRLLGYNLTDHIMTENLPCHGRLIPRLEKCLTEVVVRGRDVNVRAGDHAIVAVEIDGDVQLVVVELAFGG